MLFSFQRPEPLGSPLETPLAEKKPLAGEAPKLALFTGTCLSRTLRLCRISPNSAYRGNEVV